MAVARPSADEPAVSPAGSSGIMVQIAAVVREADAQTLAQALRRNGYPAVVRTEPQDKFLHVQIGPFASRDQARAMRARLAANGYNAFLKQ
jgi:cell division septation protein DedD